MKYSIVHLIHVLTVCNGVVLRSPAKEQNVKRILVSTAQGTVEGTVEVTRRNTTYSSFKGIPFARPPLGPLRFKDPLPPVPWEGVLATNQFREACAQSRDKSSHGSEDCLYLNVYTPHTDVNSPMPVLVHIHGGAFTNGDSKESPESILNEHMVIVTVTYRVGVLGFLSLDTSDVPGNAAMKDLVMSLRWVKQNIRKFSGNPDNVTIAGISAGGASVSLLQASPMARGLFNKVLFTSGTCLCDWAVQKNPKGMAAKLGEILDLDTDNIEDFVDELRDIPVYELSQAGINVQADRGGLWEDLTFVPVLESSFDGVEPFLRKMPLEYIRNGEFYDCPTMIGHASKEFALFHYENQTDIDINDDLVVVPDIWRLEASDDEVKRLAYLIRDHYLGTQAYDASDRQMVLNAVELLGDMAFTQPIIETTGILAKHLQSAVYSYRFSYRGGLNHAHVEKLGLQGATHGDDFKYLYDRNNPVDDFSSDGYVRRRFIKLVTNFAKTGNPTPKPSTLLPTQWLPVTPHNDYYLEINGENTLGSQPNNYRTIFWKNLEKKWRNGSLW